MTKTTTTFADCDLCSAWALPSGTLVQRVFLADFTPSGETEFEFSVERPGLPTLEWTCRDTETLRGSNPQEVFDLMVECDADRQEGRKGWAWRQLRLMDLGLPRSERSKTA